MPVLAALLKMLFASSLLSLGFFASGRRLHREDTAKLIDGQATQVTSPSLPWGFTSNMVWGDPDLAEFTDANILCVDGRSFAVHRAVLAAASPVFRKTFSVPMREAANQEISIADASSDTIESMLAWIYSGDFNASHAYALLPLAHLYEISDLVDICISSMVSIVEPDNVVSIVLALRPLVDCLPSARAAWARVVRAASGRLGMTEKLFLHVQPDVYELQSTRGTATSQNHRTAREAWDMGHEDIRTVEDPDGDFGL